MFNKEIKGDLSDSPIQGQRYQIYDIHGHTGGFSENWEALFFPLVNHDVPS